MERLTKTYSDGTHGASDNLPCGENSYNYKNLLLEKLGKYEDLEEQGRLIKLPCKVGDDVYYILGIPNETPCTIGTCIFKLSDIHKIGKTVFLTKSEAEAKLKELRGAK